MKIQLSKYLWLDGKFVTENNAQIPITTHALHYGTSAFEGIRGYSDSKNLFIFRLDDHIKRFRKSGEFYDMRLDYSDKEIKNAIIELCKKNNLKTSTYIRPFYFVGDYGISLHVTNKAPTHLGILTFELGALFNKNGITIGVSSWRKFSDMSTPTQAKMGGNYLNSIIATQEAKRNGYDEALLLDHHSNVSEGSGENIFIVKDDKLITPPISSSPLDGLTKDAIIKIARDLSINVIEREIPRSELYIASEIFLSGTAAEIIPVKSIDKKKIGDGRVGAITKKMMKEYDDIVMNRNNSYSQWITQVH